MGDDERSFPQVKTRLEELASEAAKKDTPLEKCLDLLEEGERLARRCTELIDQTEWRAAAGEQEEPEDAEEGASDTPGEEPDEGRAEDPGAGEAPVEEPAEGSDEAPEADSPEDEEPEESEQGS